MNWVQCPTCRNDITACTCLNKPSNSKPNPRCPICQGSIGNCSCKPKM